MARIFVSYRRGEDSGHAGRLYDRLAERFGDEQVFMDVEALDPGVDFVEQIETTVGAVDAFIAIIGPEWLECRDAAGSRRLDDPHDFVRLELAHALARGIRVIPVLVRGATMPSPVVLPDDLKPLVRRNALIVSDTEWQASVARLIDSLEQALGARATPPAAAPLPARTPRRFATRSAVLAAAGLLVLVFGTATVAALVATRDGDTDARGSSATLPAGTDCGDGIVAGERTSCPFARNVRNAFVNAPGNVFHVHSPVTGTTHRMECTSTSPHTCTGGERASVSFTTDGTEPRFEAKACNENVAAGPNTSCPFAVNVRAEFLRSGAGEIEVFSPVTGRRHTMSCTATSPHVCTGGNGASVYFP